MLADSLNVDIFMIVNMHRTNQLENLCNRKEEAKNRTCYKQQHEERERQYQQKDYSEGGGWGGGLHSIGVRLGWGWGGVEEAQKYCMMVSTDIKHRSA